ncbi:uncharacterized protein LOC127431665 [Myxocyprinus asiaticus]|uniref:uncharacterized protein LOC127431665 n=1 Tax=Myxocyprinus asiaticus TaxID=70543 RepID=UPI002222DFEC|nr:uncharacterized protein LOC127431665 [Myxocyprinus asiaticus]
MVIADNEIKLKDIQSRVVEDNRVFGNIAAIRITSISRTLAKHRVQMKQLYKVSLYRNGERIKELRRQYVQIVMDLEANQVPHEMIYVDEAGFNLAKRRWHGRHIIGKRATVTVPGQRGANITKCATISNNGALLHKCEIGPYNTDHLLLVLEDLHERLVPEVERGQDEEEFELEEEEFKEEQEEELEGEEEDESDEKEEEDKDQEQEEWFPRETLQVNSGLFAESFQNRAVCIKSPLFPAHAQHV